MIFWSKNTFYDTIDTCTMGRWNRIFSEKQWFEIVKKGQKKKLTNAHIEAMDRLMDSYIDAFGFSKQMKRYNILQMQLIKAKLDFIITGKTILKNKVVHIESDLNELKKLLFSGEKKDFEKQLVIIEKWYGNRIDLDSVTVRKYKSIEIAFSEDIKRNNKTPQK